MARAGRGHPLSTQLLGAGAGEDAPAATGTIAVTGGGVVTTSGQKGAQRANALTGGGVVTIVASAFVAPGLPAGIVTLQAIQRAGRRRAQPPGMQPLGGSAGEDQAGTTTVAITGGGVVTSARQKGAQRSGALTGGGVVTSAGQKGAQRANVLTGGGVVTFGATAARSGVLAITGGGVVTSVRTTNRNVTIAITGGGVVTLVGSAAITATVPPHAIVTLQAIQKPTVVRAGRVLPLGMQLLGTAAGDDQAFSGTLVVTGGGVVTLVGSASTPARAPGGIVTLQAIQHPAVLRSGRRVSGTQFIPAGAGDGTQAGTGTLSVTGGGVVTLARTAARNGTIAITGGGVVTIPGQKGAFGSGIALPYDEPFPYDEAADYDGVQPIAVTGGGVVTFASSGAHQATVAVTGGGAVVASLRQKGGQSALVVTGGGVVTLVAAVSPQAEVVLNVTGGGVVASTRQKGARRTGALTGGGVVTLDTALDRRTTLSVTGGGEVILQVRATPPPPVTVGARLPNPRLFIEVLSDTADHGPGQVVGIIHDAAKVGWSWYSRFPSNCFFSLRQNSVHNTMLLPLRHHIRVWYRDDSANYGPVLVFAGRLGEPDASGDDVVWTSWNYLADLSLSRSGFDVKYPEKTIAQIVTPEWSGTSPAGYGAKVKNRSILAHVDTGTIEVPGSRTNIATPLKTDTRFGVKDVPRLLLFYDLSEMGRANTNWNVTFEITRSLTATFNYWRNRGTLRNKLALTMPGNVIDYHFVPGFLELRNDMATVGGSTGGTEEEVVSDGSLPLLDASMDTYGRRQDVFTIKTMAGIQAGGGGDEVADQKAIANRAAIEASSLAKHLQVDVRYQLFQPFDGWDIEDQVPVEIKRGRDNIDDVFRLVGARGLLDQSGYHQQLFLLYQPLIT